MRTYPPLQAGYPSGYGLPFAPPAEPGFNGFQQPYGQPNASFPQAPQYGSPPGPQFNHQPFPPAQPMPGPDNGAYAPPSQYQMGPSQSFGQNGLSRPPYGANSPAGSYHVSPPPQSMSQPHRPNSLPPAPGLPQRPSFGAPPVNSFQMQQMHQGQIPGPPATSFNQQHPPPQSGGPAPGYDHSHGKPPPATTSTPAVVGPETGKSSEAAPEKKPKKDNIKLVYSDNETSPEEKMAKLSRYAFDPKEREETVLGEITATVTGVASGPEDPVREANRGPGRDN